MLTLTPSKLIKIINVFPKSAMGKIIFEEDKKQSVHFEHPVVPDVGVNDFWFL